MSNRIDLVKNSGVVLPISVCAGVFFFIYNTVVGGLKDDISNVKQELTIIKKEQSSFVKKDDYKEDIDDLKVDLRYIRQKLDDLQESKR